jgi:hypothetical protein
LRLEEARLRLNRTKGAVVWMRAHFDGRLRVEIRGAGRDSCVVLVRRGDEPMRETRLAVDAASARDAADGIVREIFPHTCSNADCGDWVEMAPARPA